MTKDKTKKKELIEMDLIEAKFKKMWLSDKSGYWFEKSYKFPIFDKIKVLVDTNHKTFGYEIENKKSKFYPGEPVCCINVWFRYKTVEDIINHLKKNKLK